jgi:branched-chain amino acid transport system substrate-binding protein
VGEARRLTSVDKVSVIFGTYSSSLSLAATQVAELAGVPYFELGAVSDPITERGFKNVYRTNPTARMFANRMVSAVAEAVAPALGVDPKSLKIAIIHEDSLYGQTVAGYQQARAKEMGLNVVETLPYSAKSVDLTPVILRLKSAGVDVVLQTSYQNDTVLFFRQMKEQGFKPKAVMGAGGVALLHGDLQAAEALVTEQGEAAGERIERTDLDGVLSKRRRCRQRQAGGERRLDENLHLFPPSTPRLSRAGSPLGRRPVFFLPGPRG